MRKFNQILLIVFVCFFAVRAQAHFGVITPSDDIIDQSDSRTLQVQAKFIHPMEQHYMEMEKPRQFGVKVNGEKLDLLQTIKVGKGKGAGQENLYTFWQTEYRIKRPGDYTFYMEPAPYWEPAEDLFIVHYTKVCVNALGLEQGWDDPVGLETEIIPFTRPYGLWAGNMFTGQVLLKGKPAPLAEIEVEYLNEAAVGLPLKAPASPYITQVVKADTNGVFSYVMPKAGWWGFSALSEASWKMKHQGQEKAVEIGAVYWVKTRDINTAL